MAASYAFTEPGATTLSSVLNSERTVAINVAIMHAFVRMHKLLDADLAALYEVPTKRLNEQVKRNLDRFPEASRIANCPQTNERGVS